MALDLASLFNATGKTDSTESDILKGVKGSDSASLLAAINKTESGDANFLKALSEGFATSNPANAAPASNIFGAFFKGAAAGEQKAGNEKLRAALQEQLALAKYREQIETKMKEAQFDIEWRKNNAEFLDRSVLTMQAMPTSEQKTAYLRNTLLQDPGARQILASALDVADPSTVDVVVDGNNNLYSNGKFIGSAVGYLQSQESKSKYAEFEGRLLSNAKESATLPYAVPQAQANLTKSQAEAFKATSEGRVAAQQAAATQAAQNFTFAGSPVNAPLSSLPKAQQEVYANRYKQAAESIDSEAATAQNLSKSLTQIEKAVALLKSKNIPLDQIQSGKADIQGLLRAAGVQTGDPEVTAAFTTLNREKILAGITVAKDLKPVTNFEIEIGQKVNDLLSGNSTLYADNAITTLQNHATLGKIRKDFFDRFSDANSGNISGLQQKYESWLNGQKLDANKRIDLEALRRNLPVSQPLPYTLENN
jgi:hypothetical protein